MEQFHLHGALIEIAADLSGEAVADGPMRGEALKRVAQSLSRWAAGPTFQIDCTLSGLQSEAVQRDIERLASCAERDGVARL